MDKAIKYRKKPIVVDAMQYTGSLTNINMLLEFGSPHLSFSNGKIVISTLKGDIIANVRDWIIEGIDGEFYPCKPNIFEKTYEKVDE